MYDLSQAITVPAPWPIDLGIIVVYGFAGWLICWMPYLRRGSENMIVWPLQVMIGLRVTGACFGFMSTSPFRPLIAAKDYTNWIFTICWDLGFVALLFHQISCIAIVLHLRIPLYYNIARYTWATIAALVVTIAQVAQLSNIIAGYTWTHNLTRERIVTLNALLAISGLFRIYIVFCIATVVLELTAFSYALLSQRRQRGPLTTVERAQRTAFFGSLPFMGLYLGFACLRFWTGREPTNVYFTAFQVVPEAIVTWFYVLLTCYTIRWDHWRKTEQDVLRKERKHDWGNTFHNAIEYSKWIQTKRISMINRPKPPLVALVELRFGLRADARAVVEKNDGSVLETLQMLKQVAEIILENMLLEQRPMMPLRKRDESRKPDNHKTELVVVGLLVANFKPITVETAERLAHEWTPVFTSDPEQLGPTLMVRVRSP